MKKFILNLVCISFLLIHSKLSAQSWTSKSDVPGTGRLAAFSFAIGDKIYVGGGVNHKDFYEYNTSNDSWTKKADVPGVNVSRSFCAGFAINGKGYAGSGLNNWPDTIETMKDLWEYDPLSNSWSQKADMPGTGVSGAAVMVLNDKAYFVCGSDSAATNFVYEYNPGNDQWTKKNNYPAGKMFNPMAFVIGSKGYVTGGGVQQIGLPPVGTKKTYEYDPSNDTWTAKADFPGNARESALSFSVNGKGYVGSGANASYSTFYSNFFSYDPGNNTWTAINDPLPDEPRAFPVAVVANGRAFAGAGWNIQGSTEQYFSTWYEFVLPSSIRENNLNSIHVFPNPVLSKMQIQLNDFESTISLQDIYGNEIRNIPENQDKNLKELDMSGLASGVYILSIKGKNTLNTIKILKE